MTSLSQFSLSDNLKTIAYVYFHLILVLQLYWNQIKFSLYHSMNYLVTQLPNHPHVKENFNSFLDK